MKIALLSLLTAVTLTACSTNPPEGTANFKNYQSAVSYWKDRSATELVAVWGKPDQVTVLNQRTHYVYLTRTKTVLPTQIAKVATSFDSVNQTPAAISAPETIYQSCATVFAIDKEMVTDTGYRGEGCQLGALPANLRIYRIAR